MADNQKISNQAKLKDLETQLELARARTETIEARVETIKALMKIDEIREKEACEKEVLEKKPELLTITIADDTTCAPWESSYVSGVDARMTIAFSRKIDEIREKEAREKEFLKKEAAIEKEASEKILARAAIEIAEAREKEVHEKEAREKEAHEKEAFEQLEKLSVNHLWGNQQEFLKTMKMMNIESLESSEAVKTKLKKADLHSCDDDTTCPWDSSYVSGVDTDMTIAFSRKFDEILEKEAAIEKEAVIEKEASEKMLARAAIELRGPAFFDELKKMRIL